MNEQPYGGYDTTSNELVERPHRNSPGFLLKKKSEEDAKVAMEFSRILEERAVPMRNRIYDVLENFSGEKDELYIKKFVEKLSIIAKVGNEEYCAKVKFFLLAFTESEKSKFIEMISKQSPVNMDQIVSSFFAAEP
jgi:hypothetical protein